MDGQQKNGRRDGGCRLRDHVGRLGWAVLTVMLATASTATVAQAEGRVALVVGNSDYPHIGRLPNPGNDATDLGAALGRIGFDVTIVRNAGLSALTDALRAFTRQSAGADVALVFYAGHGMEMDGVNYLLPVDARLEQDTDVRYETVTLDDVLTSTSGAGLRLVILDACRNNPLARSMRRTMLTRVVSGGSLGDLNEDLLGDETLVAYSAAAGTTADDGEGRNSPYAAALLAHLEDPVDIGLMFRRVRARVLSATGNRQRPHEYASLLREHYLSEWDPLLPPPPKLRAGDVFRDDCLACPEMVVIPKGEFRMGAVLGDSEAAYVYESPDHMVGVGWFALGLYEVTRGEYRAFVEATGFRSSGCWNYPANGRSIFNDGHSWREPGFEQGERHPAVCVNWEDAQAYVSWLRRETGKAYRLPSESEWEYAARGNRATSRYWGDRSLGQCENANGMDAATKRFFSSVRQAVACDDRAVQTAGVGSYLANPFGLFDMLGNVWEWVEDCLHENYRGAPNDGTAWEQGGSCSNRMIRGGSWANPSAALRSAARGWYPAVGRYDSVGFRVARTLDLDEVEGWNDDEPERKRRSGR